MTACSITSVIAGAGYGKTTAAREYLKIAGIPYAWIPLTDGDPDVLWDKLCTAVEPHNREAADELRVLGLPTNAWQTSRAVKLAREVCLQPFLICIDDYHLLPDDSQIHKLIETLAFEDLPNLHLLILSRAQPRIRLYTLASKEKTTCIDSNTLAFNIEETDGYLATRGLRLTKGAVENIRNSSGGWISAIYLLSEGIRAGGEIGWDKGIDALFEDNLLKLLSEAEREMLYRLSAFPSFPLEMAATALETEEIRPLIKTLWRENAFITKDEDEQYSFHPLLGNYLRRHCPEDERQKGVYRRAGLWYAAQSGYRLFFSVELFEKADCVEEFLALCNKPGASRLRFRDKHAICRLATQLPEDYCLKYPFPYLHIIFILLLSGDQQLIRFACGLHERMRQYFTTAEHPYRDLLLGELIVISCVFGFAEQDGEHEPLEEAARLLHGRPSVFLEPSYPFTFGLPMLMHTDYMCAGTLDKTLASHRTNPYELVSDGFGQGCVPLLQGEAALLRGDVKQAKLLCSRAMREASEKRQTFIAFSAHFALLRRALFLGESEQAAGTLEDMRGLVTLESHSLTGNKMSVMLLREALMLSECFYYTTLRQTDAISTDFLNGTHQPQMAGGLGIPQAYSARAMLVTGNPMGALQMCQQIDHLPQICQEARLWGLIVTALAAEELTGKGTGKPALVTALIEAQQDGILLPFAELPELLLLIRQLKRTDGIDTGFLASVVKQCEAYRAAAPAAQVLKKVSLSGC
jgi:LuxR family maltose regulon positive regulatory protein